MGKGRDVSDRTAKARIRDAGITRFATQGFSATNVKDIASDAGVSAALVMHHYGSKDGLREACDLYVAALIRDLKTEAMAAGPNLDPLDAVRQFGDDPPVMRYLARTLADSSPGVDRLVDHIVDDAQGYIQVGIDSGLLKPVDNHRDLAAVLTLWSLGSLVLHDHARRLLGADLVSGDVESRMRWMSAALPIFTDGIINGEFLKQALAAHQANAGAGADSGVENTRPDPPGAS